MSIPPVTIHSRSASVASSNGSKPTSLPHPYLKRHPSLTVHPDFPADGDGDVVLLSQNGGREVGFRVLANVLRASSGVFVQELARTSVVRHGVMTSTNSSDDIHAILRFLYVGHPRFNDPFRPTLDQYMSITSFVVKYKTAPYLTDVLSHMVATDADTLANVGEHPPHDTISNLVSVAHTVKSTTLWDALLSRGAKFTSGGWKVIHDPWGGEGPQWALLLLLARANATTIAYGDMTITYPDDKTLVVRSKNGGETVTHYLV